MIAVAFVVMAVLLAVALLYVSSALRALVAATTELAISIERVERHVLTNGRAGSS